MKAYLKILIFALGFPLIANSQSKQLKPFNFMLGHWEMKTEKGKITESWAKKSRTYGINGKSYTHNLKGDSVLTETIVLKAIQGKFYFCVTGLAVNNTGTTNFKLVSTKANTFIFENKAHDFPQRIVYQNKGKNNLLAWIEGEINGKKIKSVFAYVRKK